VCVCERACVCVLWHNVSPLCGSRRSDILTILRKGFTFAVSYVYQVEETFTENPKMSYEGCHVTKFRFVVQLRFNTFSNLLNC